MFTLKDLRDLLKGCDHQIDMDDLDTPRCSKCSKNIQDDILDESLEIKPKYKAWADRSESYVWLQKMLNRK